ncbi:MAG: hypothetical protein ABI904_10035 [Chloroflexota bacterium]
MSRLSKFLLLILLVVFILACNTVTKPIKDVQNVSSTVESFASALPIETLQSFATNLPVSTLEAVASQLPDFGNMFNPQGEPVKEWNSIPVMPQATAGQENDKSNYSFKFTGTAKEASDFYSAEMVKLGWTSLFSMPGQANGAILAFQKDSQILTITIVTTDKDTVVLLTLA